MFELNLIKDKAAQRQRRRVIFLSIMMIVFLSGLLSIFVGSLIWSELTKIKSITIANESKKTSLIALKSALDTEQPLVEDRRKGLIRAYNESVRVRSKTPRFAPLLMDIAEDLPRETELWYNGLSIKSNDDEPLEKTNAELALANGLISGNHRFKASGYVLIKESDVVTEDILSDIAGEMSEIKKMMKRPRFNFSGSTGGNGQPGNQVSSETSKYKRFTLEASRRNVQNATEGME